MKKLLFVAVAVFMMTGTAVAAEDRAAIDNQMTVNVSGDNHLDVIISLINSYYKKVKATSTMKELEAVYESYGKEMAEYESKNASEIVNFYNSLTDRQKEKYGVEYEKALRRFMALVEEKSAKFMGK
jgi:hypothetical protein